MNLSKACDSISHLLIAKMHADGFSTDSLIYFYSYLRRRKQNEKINNTHSVFKYCSQGLFNGKYLAQLAQLAQLLSPISPIQR